MQFSGRRLVRVAALIFMAMALALSAQAATFNDASVKGSYSFLTNLWTASTSTNQFAMVGVMTFDGAGGVTGSYTSISHDTVQSGALDGTYMVNSNGTGTITLTTGSTAHFTFTLNSTAAGLAHGLQLLQMNDASNEIISGTAALQSTTTVTYSLASLKGNFAFQYNPLTDDTTLAEDGGVGIFTFDGKGNLTGSITNVFDGAVFTNTFAGTYTMTADGSGSISITSKHNPQLAFALNTVAGGHPKAFQFLDTNTADGSGNLVIVGNALKQ